MTEISSASRLAIRPGFELIYAHYAGVKGMDASWTGPYRDMVNGNTTGDVEGGGGDYGGNSGGYDGLGYGTLLFRLSYKCGMVSGLTINNTTKKDFYSLYQWL